MSDVQDQMLTCADCRKEFPFSASEQDFFSEKGFAPPKRCKECRQANRERRADSNRKGDKK